MMNPGMNPDLTPEWRATVEFEAFAYSICDYWDFDYMIRHWNLELKYNKSKKRPLRVFAFPEGKGLQIKHNLREKSDRGRVFSLVDPRMYDWRAPPPPGKTLSAKPPRWFYDGTEQRLQKLRRSTVFCSGIEWEYRAGRVYPAKKVLGALST